MQSHHQLGILVFPIVYFIIILVIFVWIFFKNKIDNSEKLFSGGKNLGYIPVGFSLAILNYNCLVNDSGSILTASRSTDYETASSSWQFVPPILASITSPFLFYSFYETLYLNNCFDYLANRFGDEKLKKWFLGFFVGFISLGLILEVYKFVKLNFGNQQLFIDLDLQVNGLEDMNKHFTWLGLLLLSTTFGIFYSISGQKLLLYSDILNVILLTSFSILSMILIGKENFWSNIISKFEIPDYSKFHLFDSSKISRQTWLNKNFLLFII